MIQKQIRFVSDMTSNTIDDMYFEMHPVSVTCIDQYIVVFSLRPEYRKP